MILILLSFCRSNLSDFAKCRYTETEKKKDKEILSTCIFRGKLKNFFEQRKN